MIHELCIGCNKVKDNNCSVYNGQEDRQHTRIGGCPMRTHNRVGKAEEKGFIDPLKLSKRTQKGVKI